MMLARSDSPIKQDLNSTTSGELLDESLNSSSGSLYQPSSGFYHNSHPHNFDPFRQMKQDSKPNRNFPIVQSSQNYQTFQKQGENQILKANYLDNSDFGYQVPPTTSNTASMFVAAAYAYAAGCQNPTSDYSSCWNSNSRYGYQPFYPTSYSTNSSSLDYSNEFNPYTRNFPIGSEEHTRECVNCGIVGASIWRMDANGLFLCNDCYNLQKTHIPSEHDSSISHQDETEESRKSQSSHSSLNFLVDGALEKDDRPKKFEELHRNINQNTAQQVQKPNQISPKKPAFRRNALVCTNCATTQTTLWRRNLDAQPVCNACGLYQKLHGRTRPVTMRKDSIQTRKRKSKKRRDLDTTHTSSFVQEALAVNGVDPSRILTASLDFSINSKGSGYINESSLIDQLNPFTANALGKMNYKFDDPKNFNPFDMLLSTSASGNGPSKQLGLYPSNYSLGPTGHSDFNWLNTASSSSFDYDVRKNSNLSKTPNFPSDLIENHVTF